MLERGPLRYKEKQELKQIEKIRLDGNKKLDLALLILGKKEATQLGSYDIIGPESHKKKLQKEFGSEFETIKKVLDKIGLLYYTEGVKEDRGILGFSFLITRNNRSLKKIRKAVAKKDDKTFGLMMGYPETAVNTYRTEEALDIDKDLSEGERKQLEDENLLPFVGFKPSKSHWKEELEYVKHIQTLIKERSPKLYRQMIEDYKKESESTL